VVNSINYTDSAKFQSTELSEYTVDGESRGQFKSVGNLNFLRVYEAGHEVPYYRKCIPSPYDFLLHKPHRAKAHSYLQNPLLPSKLSHRL
jgi:hypothetical protein